jgi:hypothetical protein
MWWENVLTLCCGMSSFWVATGCYLGGVYTPPICPVCDPVGARKGDADAIAALASDINRDRAMLEAVVKAGPERVAVLLDVSQDGKPLGRLQHPDDKAEIERLRAEVERLHAEEHMRLLFGRGQTGLSTRGI